MKCNVLVFPCGSEIALELHRSLVDQKDINLIGASSVDDHGKFVFENYIDQVPFVNEDGFIPCVSEIILKHKIDLIYPCMDKVISVLKDNESKLGCEVVGSPSYTNNICLSKSKTYEALNGVVKTPKIFNLNNVEYPAFLKPDIGYGARNTFKVDDDAELSSVYDDHLILEYLPYEEYTVDCFTDRYGNLLFSQARERKRVSHGISVNTVLYRDDKINDITQAINSKLDFNGAWFFQVKRDKNKEYTLLEVASRFAGSSSIQRLRGVNLPYLNILNFFKKDLEVIAYDYEVEVDRSLDVKGKLSWSFENVYVDLDDTLITNDKVNLKLIQLLYKFLNENKKIYLITRHNRDPLQTLSDHKIYNFFEDVIHITDNSSKALHINGSSSIFIDDSFQERLDVWKMLRIPCFDVSSLEVF